VDENTYFDPTKQTSFSPIGMSFETASKLIVAAGYTVRISKQGSISYFLRQDFKTNRINLTLDDNDIVISFSNG
jgi:hypothetical protein